MHRAEKSSSKICRAREVVKAQETHRKKIDGVRSNLCGIAPKSRSSSVNLRPTRSKTTSFSSTFCIPGEYTENSANSELSMDLEQISSKTGSGKCEVLTLDKISNPLDDFQKALAKMEEFREVAPVPGLSATESAKNQIKVAPPPGGTRRKTMNGSFRARRLKEIKADNAEVFERIRKSASHYRNDDLKREWQKNVSFLSSIREFQVSNAQTKQQTNDEIRNYFGPSPRRPSFLKPSKNPDPLPVIPVIAHPIKSIPTSPKKQQLNMSTAFRSLRKAMPQQPTLPPISTPRSTEFSLASSNPRDRSTCPSSPGLDPHFADSTKSYRSSTAATSTKFIGDLHAKQPENENSKYELLKTGRFVGGTYLVLTVFCGDGVTNPYGFDVCAFHRELQCEYKLSITKEMTHDLLDKISSSSLAAETAAAAGTNLSMQEIALHICDHISFAVLGADQGEMIFFAPNTGQKSDQAVRFDASPGLVAFCLHQTVEIEPWSPRHSNIRPCKSKAHIFASTCPPTVKVIGKKDATGLKICFHVMDNVPPQSSQAVLRVEASVDDLYSVLNGSCLNENQIISMERIVVAAIRHLHIISVPSGDELGSLRNELIVNSHLNTILQPMDASLGKKRSKQQLPHSSSQVFSPRIRPTILIHSGLIWRNVYLLAEIALDNVQEDWINCESQVQSQQRLIRDSIGDVVVRVFNSSSGRSTGRILSPKKIDALFEKLETKTELGDIFRELHTFARYLLQYLQLDVNLFGQEVIIFPYLENASTPVDKREKRSERMEKSSPEDHHEEATLCSMSWGEGNISEGDEEAESDEFEEQELDPIPSIGLLPDGTEAKDEREESNINYSYVNQEEVDIHQHLDGHVLTAGETPEGNNLESTAPAVRQWRKGCKIDGRFCLSKGYSENVISTYWIEASG
ncbi:hypothetical protein P3T76_006891 [Phytophthora citrophthora]|uniref:Uncharacterized protein n=1 Tax=Phytophthora citrophthora TaxID=4793 RepID=A0AAD9LNI5_9STRA|nr:hypothetical protein P3T76_006891 [Phytophthora citrophthora]